MIQTFLAWPQFHKTYEAQIKWIVRYVIGNTAIVLVSRIDECFQMRQNLGDFLRREPKYSKHGYFWIHTFLVLIGTLRPNSGSNQ